MEQVGSPLRGDRDRPARREGFGQDSQDGQDGDGDRNQRRTERKMDRGRILLRILLRRIGSLVVGEAGYGKIITPSGHELSVGGI